ncbi:hypothetical protein SCLCIDRAFT_34032 [Scleroderma citrinum Foug A]|uniref:Uncharacterized protein n=1 Tax=Scleroderma citrinum Foug A TaxID=1036808 RepID=A0A0C3CQ86_9AGAM|nr:hypothetical protein SCLCIDRAFT_34032 [Scleroderma citrinum Foug A]
MVIDFAQPSEPSRPSLAGRLEEPKETMFPLLGRGEVPNHVQVLLDGKKFLHIQFNDCVYQFEEPHRRDILRNINRGITPPITGAIWPGAVPLLNTKAELDRLYALVAQELDEQNSPNTRLGQKFVAWLNRYMGDVDCVMGKKPPKTDVIIHALKKWRPPVWASARGKSKHNGYKQAHRAQRDQLDGSTSQPPASIPETTQPPAASMHHLPTPEAVQPPATSSSFAPAHATASTRMFGVVSTSREPTPAPVPPLILMWWQRTTHKQDGLPKGAPGWGDKIAEWHNFIHRLSWAGFVGSFPGVSNHADPEHTEPPTDRRLKGFILEGYFAPCFKYPSNHNSWRCNFAKLFAVLGRYRAIVKREGWTIMPGRSLSWTGATDQALSPLAIAGYLAQNSLSFQEADDLFEWAVAAIREEVGDCKAELDIDLAVVDTYVELSRSLEYYMERAAQGEELLEF